MSFEIESSSNIHDTGQPHRARFQPIRARASCLHVYYCIRTRKLENRHVCTIVAACWLLRARRGRSRVGSRDLGVMVVAPKNKRTTKPVTTQLRND